MAAGSEHSGCRPSLTGSRRRWGPCSWSHWWSRGSTRTPTAIGPGKSAHQAVAACRVRCWKNDWVIDLDVQKFFDEVPWDLVVRAVEAVTEARWVLLYVKRWLAAPLKQPDGSLVERTRGTPQGSAVSPILVNLFMHYA